jgi:thioredoxin reductase
MDGSAAMLLRTFICINGRGPTALTTGIYVARVGPFRGLDTQQHRHVTDIISEIITVVDFFVSPFHVASDSTVLTDAVIVTTSAVAHLLHFTGSDVY